MLFGNELLRERRERLESSVDLIRSRFGRQAIRRAVLIGDDITGESDPLTHDVHPVAFNF
jgi:DNA polymerase-4